MSFECFQIESDKIELEEIVCINVHPRKQFFIKSLKNCQIGGDEPFEKFLRN